MIIVRPPYLIRKLYNGLVWKIPTKEKCLYLTFDDGPIPEATPFVIETLKQFNAKATFFCIGDNVRKHGDVFKLISENGHVYGNHSNNHFNGWFTRDDIYLKNVEMADELLHARLFRPPYGRIKFSQARALKKKYKIIMWDVLSRDYNVKLSGDECYNNVINYAKPGSIVVFHDSVKALPRLQYALPKVLEYFSNLGYVFKSIDENKLI